MGRALRQAYHKELAEERIAWKAGAVDYVKAKTIAEPYVVKGMEIAGPYVAAVKARVLPKTVEQID